MNLFRLPCGIPWGGARRLVLTLACLFRPLRSLRAERDASASSVAKLKTVMDEITRQCDLSFAYSRGSGRCRPDRQYRSERRADRCGVAEPFPVGERDRLCDQETAKSCFRRVNSPCMSTPLSRDGWPTTRTARSWGRPWSWRHFAGYDDRSRREFLAARKCC